MLSELIPPGHSAKLLFGPEFTSEKVQLLELVDEAMLEQIVAHGVVIKGGADDDAVLCTKSKTYAIKQAETSNTLLLIPGRQKRPEASPAGEKRKASSSLDEVVDGHELGLQTQRACLDEMDCGEPVVATCSAASHFELVEIAPQTERIETMLLQHVYSQRDEARSETTSFAFASADLSLAGARPPALNLPVGRPRVQGASAASTSGVSWEELVDSVQASEEELRKALRSVGALCLDGRYMSVDPAYGREVLDNLILSAAAVGVPLSAVDEEKVVESMKADGYDERITCHCLSVFGAPAGAADGAAAEGASQGLWALDERKVMRSRAQGLLAKQPKWKSEEFWAELRDKAPEGFDPKPEDVAGEAITESSFGETWLVAYPERALPRQPRQRFAALFALKPSWLFDELLPYLQTIQGPGKTVEALLLEHTRCTQPSAQEPPLYSAR